MKTKIIALLLGVLVSAGSGSVIDSDINSNEFEDAGIKNITAGIERTLSEKQIREFVPNGSEQNACMDFAVDLIKVGYEKNQNTLLSPLSVMSALAMTANGAQNQTLNQMEDVFGMDMDVLNKYLAKYMKSVTDVDSTTVIDIANSIWLKDKDDEGFKFKEKFLQTNVNYYDAAIFKSDFKENTKIAINNWVNKNTHGMIPEILDEIDKDAIMYLVNALAFESEWQSLYDSSDVWDDEFTKIDGSKKNMEFMYSEEDIYLSDNNTSGFMKAYSDGRHSFVGLLPNEDIDINEYVKSLTGDKILDILNSKQYKNVQVAIPKFTSQSSKEMSNILKKMGMVLPFDKNLADFKAMGEYTNDMVDYNLSIARVLHKTFIEVEEKGTKAAAATAVEIVELTSAMPEEFETVVLDRPFVYMIIDHDYNMPVFIGVFTADEAK